MRPSIWGGTAPGTIDTEMRFDRISARFLVHSSRLNKLSIVFLAQFRHFPPNERTVDLLLHQLRQRLLREDVDEEVAVYAILFELLRVRLDLLAEGAQPRGNVLGAPLLGVLSHEAEARGDRRARQA